MTTHGPPGGTPASGVASVAAASAEEGDHRWASLFPTLCAVHCLVTPAVIAVFPFLHFLDALEPVLFGVSVILAAWAVGSAWRRHHDRRVWVLTGLGAALWGASILGAFQPIPEAATDVLGGLLLAGGVFWSGRLRHRSVCDSACSCPAPH